MEFSTNSLNQPVNFYTKNMTNTINTIIDKDNRPISNNIFAPELANEKKLKDTTTQKRKRKSKRLNTLDINYLPDEIYDEEEKNCENNDNFFIENKQTNFTDNAKKAIEHFVTTTPLVNYCYMKQKKEDIEKTVESLNNINQNIDELMNTAMPYGEESRIYNDIAKNLTNAANILGNANKKK